MNRDLSKLRNRWYFFDENDNKDMIEILKTHNIGEYIKIFDIEVIHGHFKFNTLWRVDDRFGNKIRKFDMRPEDFDFDKVYDFLIHMDIKSDRILKLREIGIV